MADWAGPRPEGAASSGVRFGPSGAALVQGRFLRCLPEWGGLVRVRRPSSGWGGPRPEGAAPSGRGASDALVVFRPNCPVNTSRYSFPE